MPTKLISNAESKILQKVVEKSQDRGSNAIVIQTGYSSSSKKANPESAGCHNIHRKDKDQTTANRCSAAEYRQKIPENRVLNKIRNRV